jgi:hypothetical protein
MKEADLFKTKVVAALVLRLYAEEFRDLKQLIVEKFGNDSIIYQKISFDKLYITDEPPKRKEGTRNGKI